jgi:RNA-directed DNA polymerase
LEYTIYVLPESEKYRSFRIPKKRKDAGKRVIQEPIPNLKIIQQKLLHVLQLVYNPKPSVHGFRQGKSIVTNAENHVKRRYVFNLDLKDFFPSIHFGRVHFRAHPYNLNYKVATVLAQICSQPTGLPQGAPTSPIVSNMLCARMDSQLQTLAKRHYCYYTRYADDLTFSTSRRKFPAALAAVVTDDYNDPQKLDHRLRCFFDIILETCGEIEMAKKRRTHSNQFKFKVALEAAQELRTRNEIASQHGLHPNQVGKWKKQLLAEGPTVFDNNTAQQLEAVAEREAELYEQIGRLKMELEWLKKKAAQFS